jgi:tetratricopeptide (TPR) repeat protein
LAESKRRARSDPFEAAALAALVPTVLTWTPAAQNQGWAASLGNLALAYRANALRVAGNLPESEGIFMALRQRLATLPSASTSVLAEIASLEASLRMDQRRLAEAEERLGAAASLALLSQRTDLAARILVKQGNLLRNLDRPSDALGVFRQAVLLAESSEVASDLLLPALAGQINTLCDLDRPKEARALLDGRRAQFAADEDSFVRTATAGLEGRVHLGLGQLDAAAAAFEACRDGYLELDRTYDAALVSLDLAQVLLEEGRPTELRDLAAELVPLFRARGVARETLAALRLLAQAAAAETLTAAVLQDVRRRLEGAPAAKGE